MRAREAAYLALLAAMRDEAFIAVTLKNWEKTHHPSKQELSLAWEIAHGSMRKLLTLQHVAKQCAVKAQLDLKLKERALLYTAFYQCLYMSKVPPYAIVNETVALAKKYCHAMFAGFLNAILHKLQNSSVSIPTDDAVSSLSIRTSYPPFFIQELIHDYGLESAKLLLEVQNNPPTLMARVRGSTVNEELPPFETVHETLKVIKFKERGVPETLWTTPRLYFQNVTPSALLLQLSSKSSLKEPQSILDLCASPGGKLLGVHDLYPAAKLFANDVSEEKLKKLKENCRKYDLKAEISCGKGEEFKSDPLFDLLILDVPCSNSGVLNKRPEARWRLTRENLEALEKVQMSLLERASQLISSEGEIWYMTCSILKRENEKFIQSACRKLGLNICDHFTILPNLEGWEGGFAALLK